MFMFISSSKEKEVLLCTRNPDLGQKWHEITFYLMFIMIKRRLGLLFFPENIIIKNYLLLLLTEIFRHFHLLVIIYVTILERFKPNGSLNAYKCRNFLFYKRTASCYSVVFDLSMSLVFQMTRFYFLWPQLICGWTTAMHANPPSEANGT